MKIRAENNNEKSKYPMLNRCNILKKYTFIIMIILFAMTFASCNKLSHKINNSKSANINTEVDNKNQNKNKYKGNISKTDNFSMKKGKEISEDNSFGKKVGKITSSDRKFYIKLAKEAEKRTKLNIIYNPAYFRIKYPMGDIPENYGVCTDVIIRSYRAMGIDLQQKIHIDMKRNFSLYPKLWKLSKPDSNIDHRRVPNLMVFFKRFGRSLPINKNPKLYLPGDIVTWNLEGAITHIGIVSNKISKKTGNPLIVHNIGGGPVLQDMLFDYKITGHFRYGK